jgi:hypothetical protein
MCYERSLRAECGCKRGGLERLKVIVRGGIGIHGMEEEGEKESLQKSLLD